MTQHINVIFVFQENYERMQALVDELKSRTEKIKLGGWELVTAFVVDATMVRGFL